MGNLRRSCDWPCSRSSAAGEYLAPVFSPITNGIIESCLKSFVGERLQELLLVELLEVLVLPLGGGSFWGGVGQGALTGLATGAATGAITAGVMAQVNGFNPWTGKDLPSIRYGSLNEKDLWTLADGDGLTAKRADGTWSLEEHVEFGSSKAAWKNDPWISLS